MDYNELEEKYFEEKERSKRLEKMLKEVMSEVSDMKDSFMRMEIEQETLAEINQEQQDELKMVRMECKKLEDLVNANKEFTDSAYTITAEHMAKLTDLETRVQQTFNDTISLQTEFNTVRCDSAYVKSMVDSHEQRLQAHKSEVESTLDDYYTTVEKVLPDCEIGSSLIGRWEAEVMIDDHKESMKKYAEQQAEEYTDQLRSDLIEQMRNFAVNSRTDLMELRSTDLDKLEIGDRVWVFDDDGFYGDSQVLIHAEITKLPEEGRYYASFELNEIADGNGVYSRVGSIDRNARIFQEIQKCD